MKKLTIILLSAFLLSCENKPKVSINPSNSSSTAYSEAQEVVDSALMSFETENDFKGSFANKELIKNSPVKILKANFIQKEYSNYKDVELKYKNVSGKTINAIKFEWYGENSFGEPADMGISGGRGGGFTDEKLKPGQTSYGTWNVLSSDGKVIIGARAFEVAFSDGTKWKLY